MQEANPLSLVDDLKVVLQRYIATTLPIARRYPKLSSEFRKLLSEQKLVEGPFVEALPDFEKGSTLAELLKKNGGYVHDGLENLPTVTRKLHLHQQKAIEYSVKACKSLLVATGTGSGKTESFLYPIAHHLLSDLEPEKPGVRALLVYPMNALANDQLYYRIAPLFGRFLRDYDITFGRYTGQVKANVRRHEEEVRLLNNSKLMAALGHPNAIPSNWLLTREEMLRNPPKVLITNYAMLEHLLLLPRNERLFTANALKLIVLDEIHTYHGAQATEVAFLLRKLKNRLGITNPLQVFGTSASLADGEDADEKLKEFATGLFGETVHEVVRGKRVTHVKLQEPVSKEFSLSAADWVALGKAIEELLKLHEVDRTSETWNLFLDAAGLEHSKLGAPDNVELTHFLEKQFASNKEIRKIAKHLDSGGVKSFIDLAGLIFDSPVENVTSEIRYAALSAAIRMGMLARKDEDSFSLLPGRYHIAINSIEGLAVLPSNDEEGWSRIKATRHHRDEHGLYYPILTCRKCGQPYLEGFEEAGHLHHRRPDDRESRGERRVFWLGIPAGYVEDEDDEVEETRTAQYQKYNLDVKTGDLVAQEGAVTLYAIQTEKDEEEKAWYVRKCPACGGIASGTDAEIVTRMHPGNEALGSVVTQRVLESLPPSLVDNFEPKPALGRNLLTFSDNRQDAAFFAPYFERTSSDIALRSAIRNVLKERTSSINALQLADQIYLFWQRDGQLPVLLDINGEMITDRQDAIPIILGSLAAEFCTPGGRRNSLESLGLVNVTYDEQKLKLLTQKAKSFWPKELPSGDSVISSIIHFLLESIRRERAISKFHGVPLRDEHIWGVYNQHRSFDIATGDANVSYKWLPNQQQQTRHNRRTWYLVEQLGMSRDNAFQFLSQFWEAMVKPPISFLDRHNPGFALNGDLIRFANGDSQKLFVCKNCGLMQNQSILSKCVAYHCRGEVDELNQEERNSLHRNNHYLASYDEQNHVTVRAREHTASLSTDLRESIERDFAERRLNLLSCTTTMEMGVDLGDLEAVINLNVPPGIANYQQRTGRAGRRAQAAPFCVTIARNTNFDQKAVRDFQNYLGSSPGTPFIHLDNPELFKRHQFSILLSHFLRARITDQEINAPSLKHLFGDVFTREALKEFSEFLLKWLENPEGLAAIAEAENLVQRLPIEYKSIGSQGSYLRNLFIAAIREFPEEVCERFARYTERMAEAATASDFKKAGYWQRMREDYMGQFLVNQLSQRGLIPTYSFPVHSMNLEVMTESRDNYQSNSDVVLSRDASQGISEYAPGAEVVANGRIWESAGIAHYPKAFMPERWYVACPECFHVDVGDLPDEIPLACGNCGSSEGRRKRKFIEPHGFVTSFSKRRGRDPGNSRRRVKPADEAKLITAPRNDLFEETGMPFMLSALLKAKSADENGLKGSLFIANRGTYGEGYYRCLKCNYSEAIKPAPEIKAAAKKPASSAQQSPILKHQDPQTGLVCANEKVSRIGLDFAHRFETDVRIFRFVSPLPHSESLEMPPKRFHERVARTIAEAIRLAASEMMNLYPGEVRAIYRLNGAASHRLEVVLYDAVPGGAGYCARLGEASLSFGELIKKTIKRLDCEAGCESGCRVCLCDYGNQRHWDSFERKAAAAWLNALIDPAQSDSGPGNYVRWKSPSLAGLSERVANFNELHLVARNLVSAGTFNEECLGQLISWLQSGKRISIYLFNKPEDKPKTEAPLSVYRRLHPYVLEGALKLFTIPQTANVDIEEIPQVFVGTEENTPIYRMHFPPQALLDSIVATPSDTGVVDEATARKLLSFIEQASPLGNKVFQEGEKMRMWELHKGIPRNFDEIFSVAKGAHIKELVLRDPYCGAINNQKRLTYFLELMRKQSKQIDLLRIRCKEIADRQGNVEFSTEVEKRLDALVDSIGYPTREIFVAPQKGSSGKSFHDRELDIVTYTEDGCEEIHRYFLTGGIDYLVDQYAETRIFYIFIQK